MIKSTKIVAVDSKGGRRSRTGSFVSMGVTDREAIDCQDYFLDLADGEEPAGKVKKIELVVYYDQEEAETIESLRAENKEMREYIDNLDTVVGNAESLIDSVVIEEDAILEWSDIATYQIGDRVLYDGVLSQLGETGFFPVGKKEDLPPNQRDLKLYNKPCECETPAFVNGKCANCGGVE